MLVLLAARALAFFLQGLTQAFGTFLATRLFTGLVAGTTSVARASTCDLAAPKERSRVLAASDFAAAAALIVGPGLGGGLAAFGLHTPILVASASSVFGLALAAGLLLGMPDEEASSGAPAAEDPARSAADGGDRGGDEEGREGAGDEEEGEGEGRAVEEENEEEKVEVEEEEEGHATGPGRAHGSLAGGAASEAAAWLRHPFRRLIPVVLLASLCSVAGGTGLYTMFALLVADEFGYGADAWGFLLSGTALVVVVTQLAVYPAMARSLGKHFAAVSASLTMAVGVAIVPLAAVPAPTLLFAVLYAMGFAAVAPAAHALLLRYAPPPARARILGWQGALTSFAHVVVPPFLGLFYANAPYTPFAVSALLGTSAAFLFAVALLLNQRAHEQAARAAAVETGARDGQRLLSARQREGEDEGGHTASGEGSATASGAAAAGEALTAEQVFGADTGGEGAGAGAGEDSRRASSVHSGEEAARAADVEVAPQPSIRTNTAEADTGRLLLAALRRRGLANLAAADLASRQRLHDLLERVIPPAEDVSVRWLRPLSRCACVWLGRIALLTTRAPGSCAVHAPRQCGP